MYSGKIPYPLFGIPLVFTLSGLPASIGAAADRDTITVTWEQVAKTVDSHPLLQQQTHREDASLALIEDAQAIPNPSVEISVARGKSDETGDSALEWGAALTIPLDWMATRNMQTQVATSAHQSQLAERELLRRDILRELRRLFWQTVHLQERTRRLGTLYQQTASLSTLIEKRIQNGDARPMELTRIEIEQEKVASELALATMQRDALQIDLALWLGSNTPVRCQASLMFGTTQPPPQVSATQLETHPALLRAAKQLAVAQKETRLAQKNRFPEIALTLFAENELDKSAMGAGVEVAIPLWNFNRGAIAHAKAQTAAVAKEATVQRLQLEHQRLRVNAACNASYQMARRFNTRMLPKVTEVAQKVARAYALGEATLLEVLDARRTVLEVEAQLLDAQLQARLDCSEVENMIGEKRE
ncbi:MAG: TolC family protein [Deltaproteobacteria bacterium]|nr:TolC family protein [Deltaproteobacteria bacterium]